MEDILVAKYQEEEHNLWKLLASSLQAQITRKDNGK